MDKILEEFSHNSAKYFDYLVKNISFFVIVISLLGCTIQFINLLQLSPYYLTFYSPKQGITDGLLFIIFCIGCFIFYGFIFYIFIIKILLWGKSALYTYFSALLLIAVLTYVYVGVKKMEFVGSILAIPTLLFIMLIQSTISPEPKHEIKFNADEEIEVNRRSDKFLKRFLLLLVLVFYGIYVSANQYYRKFQTENNYNFELLIEKINIKHKKKFKVLYANSDYIFLGEIASNKILIVNTDIITKEFVYD